MRKEVKSIAPVRLGIFAAVITVAVSFVFGLIGLFGGAMHQMGGAGMAPGMEFSIGGSIVGVVFVVLFRLVVGFIAGVFYAVIYNVIAGIVGGVVIELADA